ENAGRPGEGREQPAPAFVLRVAVREPAAILRGPAPRAHRGGGPLGAAPEGGRVRTAVGQREPAGPAARPEVRRLRLGPGRCLPRLRRAPSPRPGPRPRGRRRGVSAGRRVPGPADALAVAEVPGPRRDQEPGPRPDRRVGPTDLGAAVPPHARGDRGPG